MIDLSGRVALVTGASRGIGAATAKRLSEAGAVVVLAARSLDAIEKQADRIRATGGKADAVACDVSDYAAVAAAVDHCLRHHDGLDIMVNNAGVIDPIARLADSDPAEWGLAVDINYKGVYHGLRAAIPAMLARGGGTIVTISSGAATGALEGWAHYCASKAAALSLTRCADLEYRDQGIRVVGLSPGMVATEMQRKIRLSGINQVSRSDPSTHILPEWPAEAVAWLCTEASTPFLGTDFSLKLPENRALLGLN